MRRTIRTEYYFKEEYTMENAVLHSLITRRSVRRYKPDPVPQELLDQVMEAGLYAASGMGRQGSVILQVTDKALLEATGGIVQGMSGSPIIQDGKLIGTVTHVLVGAPEIGYGIFIENMLDAAG